MRLNASEKKEGGRLPASAVADNAAKDFIAPNALGWTSVRIICNDGVYYDVPPAARGVPIYTIEALGKLAEILD